MDKGTYSKVKEFVKEAAKEYPGIEATYLFGSYAQNKQTPDSDIDIALIFDKLEESINHNIRISLMKLSHKFDNRIEPHPMSKEDFADCNYQLAYEIKKWGKLIMVD